MPTHAEKRRLPYPPDKLYRLVADIERYPEFLPWCVGARIRRRDGNELIADLVIGFKMLRERYTSRVTLQENQRIDVVYAEGPFKNLNNHWIFHPLPDGTTLIEFYLDFEFRSRVLQTVMGALFNEAVGLMVGAFEKRARQLYGPPTVSDPPASVPSSAKR